MQKLPFLAETDPFSPKDRVFSAENRAATAIQRHFRGILARKALISGVRRDFLNMARECEPLSDFFFPSGAICAPKRAEIAKNGPKNGENGCVLGFFTFFFFFCCVFILIENFFFF
jgi:hypothetical protein